MHRCKYSLQGGDDFIHVAGLFEISWVQLFALNPLYTTPESPATSPAVINVGHLYKSRPAHAQRR